MTLHYVGSRKMQVGVRASWRLHAKLTTIYNANKNGKTAAHSTLPRIPQRGDAHAKKYVVRAVVEEICGNSKNSLLRH